VKVGGKTGRLAEEFRSDWLLGGREHPEGPSPLMTESGGSVVIDFDNGNFLGIENQTINNLQESDFLLV
jgi:hypothetical protein